MKRIVVAVGVLFAYCATTAASPVSTLGGRYADPGSKGGFVENLEYDGFSSVLEIIPVDSRHAYFRFLLQGFGHGKSCSLSGVATAHGSRLDYFAPPDKFDGKACHMSLYRSGADMRIDDNGGTCESSCGSGEGYAGAKLPWNSRRPIGYLGRVKNSSAYRDALTEWHAGKPVNP